MPKSKHRRNGQSRPRFNTLTAPPERCYGQHEMGCWSCVSIRMVEDPSAFSDFSTLCCETEWDPYADGWDCPDCGKRSLFAPPA